MISYLHIARSSRPSAIVECPKIDGSFKASLVCWSTMQTHQTEFLWLFVDVGRWGGLHYLLPPQTSHSRCRVVPMFTPR